MTVIQKDKVKADTEQLLKKSTDELPSDPHRNPFQVIKGTFRCVFDIYFFFAIRAEIPIDKVKEVIHGSY